jgi:hypothetical protein
MRLIFGALLFALAWPANAQDGGVFFTRLDFKELSVNSQLAYTAGVADTYTAGIMFGMSKTKVNRVSRCLRENGVTVKQIHLTAVALIDAEPEHLHWSGAAAVLEAMTKICQLGWGDL